MGNEARELTVPLARVLERSLPLTVAVCDPGIVKFEEDSVCLKRPLLRTLMRRKPSRVVSVPCEQPSRIEPFSYEILVPLAFRRNESLRPCRVRPR